jgi:hypothetical protein
VLAMRAIISGSVAKVTERSYSSKDGQKIVADVFIGEAPYYDKVSMPLELATDLAPGVEATFVANIKAKSVVSTRNGERYTFLDVWCVERVEAVAPLRAVV